MDELWAMIVMTSLDTWAFLRTELGSSLASGFGSGTAVSGGLYAYQRHHSRTLPMLPSHEGALVGGATPATRFFAAVHDLTMTVTEAWNVARLRKKSVEEVIRREHLKEASDRLEAAALELEHYLEDHCGNARVMRKGLRTVRGLWTYDNRHNYRTETYTVRTRDSNGNTRTETRTRQVYVSTDHWFTFDRTKLGPARDELAAVERDLQRRTFPNVDLDERHVELDNLAPAERSFLERLVKQTVTRSKEEVPEEELERILNQWLDGTRIGADLDSYVTGTKQGVAIADRCFGRMKNAKRKVHYNTKSKTHRGPDGYQAAQELLVPLEHAHGAWGRVESLLHGARSSAEKLLGYAGDAAVVESDQDYGEVAVYVYGLAFPDSTLEVDRLPDGYLTVGAGLATALTVAGGLYGLQAYLG